MLTDIFADRYANTKIWNDFGEPQRRLIVQGFRILTDQLRPYYVNGKEDPAGKAFWIDLQRRISMELGLESLSPLGYAFVDSGSNRTTSGLWTHDYVCKTWMMQNLPLMANADRYIKERISLIEIGFRMCGEQLSASNAALPAALQQARDPRYRSVHAIVLKTNDPAEHLIAANKDKNQLYESCVFELNTRFRQSGSGLNYHNGFVQMTDDDLSSDQIRTPFWALVGDVKWANVDSDMKEAFDRRDNGSPDAAFYAAKALESAIKIISSKNELSTGKERGAANYIDNLKRASIIDDWESDILKAYFSKVRNPMGHGPGEAPMPSLNPAQTDWAIETCMVWTKSLVRRVF
jgi:hypothetical protein